MELKLEKKIQALTVLMSSNWTIMELKSKRDIGVRGHSVLIVPTRNWNVMKTRSEVWPWQAWSPMALWMGCRARARQGWAERTSHGCTSAWRDTDHKTYVAKSSNNKKTFRLSAWRDGATPLIIMHWFAGCYEMRVDYWPKIACESTCKLNCVWLSMCYGYPCGTVPQGVRWKHVNT